MSRPTRLARLSATVFLVIPLAACGSGGSAIDQPARPSATLSPPGSGPLFEMSPSAWGECTAAATVVGVISPNQPAAIKTSGTKPARSDAMMLSLVVDRRGNTVLGLRVRQDTPCGIRVEATHAGRPETHYYIGPNVASLSLVVPAALSVQRVTVILAANRGIVA